MDSKDTPIRLQDVAQAAGVSRSTAAKVLLGTGGANTRVADATAERIRRTARKLNFRPNPIARQLSGIRSKTLGLIQDHGFSYITAHRIYLIEKNACDRGYRLMMGHAHANPRRIDEYIQDFTGRGVEGIIAIGFSPEAVERFWNARLRTCPVVFHGVVPVDIPSDEAAANVMLDRASAIRQSVRHLVERGRRRIMLVVQEPDHPLMTERLRGYRQGLADAGMAFEPALVPAAMSHEVHALNRILESTILPANPDAIIMPGDSWAVEFIRQAPRLGVRVPQDIAIVGFDNSEAAAALDLTSIDQENEKVAAMAVNMLLEMIDHGPLPPDRRNVWIEPRLVVRDSTRA